MERAETATTLFAAAGVIFIPGCLVAGYQMQRHDSSWCPDGRADYLCANAPFRTGTALAGAVASAVAIAGTVYWMRDASRASSIAVVVALSGAIAALAVYWFVPLFNPAGPLLGGFAWLAVTAIGISREALSPTQRLRISCTLGAAAAFALGFGPQYFGD